MTNSPIGEPNPKTFLTIEIYDFIGHWGLVIGN